MRCARCADAGYRVEAGVEWAEARPCDCRVPCPECDDRGFVVERPAGSAPTCRPCACRSLRRRVALFNHARIPAKMHRATIESFEEGRGEHLPELKLQLELYRQAYTPGARGLLLWGFPGVGKTHLACALVRHFTLERGLSARFVDFFQLVEQIKSGFDDGLSMDDVISPLMEPDVLVIDELGKGRPTEFQRSVLDQLVCRRYNTSRTVIVTTNFEVGTPPRPSGLPRLEDQGVGDRVCSRLYEMCHIHEVIAPDSRRIRGGMTRGPSGPSGRA